MGGLAILLRPLTRWYISSVILAGLGVLIGYLGFFQIFHGEPEIGIIGIPVIVLDHSTIAVIGDFFDFTRERDSIKAMAIKMNSGGRGAVPSDGRFLETLELRGRKPVVVVVQEATASGAHTRSMGANYIYAKPTSILGSVGVVIERVDVSPLLENTIFTGPAKRIDDPRRSLIGLVELAKQSFLDIVITQRRDKLKITRNELAEAGSIRGWRR